MLSVTVDCLVGREVFMLHCKILVSWKAVFVPKSALGPSCW